MLLFFLFAAIAIGFSINGMKFIASFVIALGVILFFLGIILYLARDETEESSETDKGSEEDPDEEEGDGGG
jgi:uncharacterized membrane protein (DUF373 family)